jgi:hypothetical protein
MELGCSLFIHHDPDAQPWVKPYYERRVSVLSGYRHLRIMGEAMVSAYEDARRYFEVYGDSLPGYTVMSDWIRCHHLLTTPRLLYSDSDVLWHSAPALGDKPLKGDTTFGIMWSGAGPSDSAKAHAFEFAQQTLMQKNINSNYLIPIDDRMDPASFYHGKDFKLPEP